MTDGRKRTLIAVGVIGVALVVYLIARSRSGSSSGAVSPGTQTPAQSAAAQQADSEQAASADLLSALAGENQSLLRKLLSGSEGLVSLAGSSLGAPTATQGAGESSSGGAGSFVAQTSGEGGSPVEGSVTTVPGGSVVYSSSDLIGAFSTPYGVEESQLSPAAQQSVLDALSSRTIDAAMGGGQTIGPGSQPPQSASSLGPVGDFHQDVLPAQPLYGGTFGPSQPLYGGSFDFSTATPSTGPTVTSPIVPGPDLGLGAVPKSKPGSGNLAA